MEERRPKEVVWPVYFWKAVRPKDGGRKPDRVEPRACLGPPGTALGPKAAVAELPGGAVVLWLPPLAAGVEPPADLDPHRPPDSGPL